MERERLRELVEAVGALLPLADAPPLDWGKAERVHDPAYLARWRSGEVTHAEELRLGFPWTPELVTRSVYSAGGTLAATGDALARGWGLHLGGGTHHASRDRAEGFAFLNDVVIAAQWAFDEGRVRRAAVLDLDVHQGNGTARMLSDAPWAWTVSLHGANNYPFEKERSSLDIEFTDGVGDGEYLAALTGRALPSLEAFGPDLLFHLAGADVLAGDQFGRLALSLEGLRERDAAVFAWAQQAGVPLVTVMAGGYNRDPAETIRARLATVEEGLKVYGPDTSLSEDDPAPPAL